MSKDPREKYDSNFANQAQKKLQGNRGVPFGLFQKLRELPLDLVWSEIERSKAAAVFVENELLLIPVWYRLDSNRVPPVYTLQSIWTMYVEAGMGEVVLANTVVDCRTKTVPIKHARG